MELQILKTNYYLIIKFYYPLPFPLHHTADSDGKKVRAMYGAMTEFFVEKLVQRTMIGRSSRFLDLGSGIGQVLNLTDVMQGSLLITIYGRVRAVVRPVVIVNVTWRAYDFLWLQYHWMLLNYTVLYFVYSYRSVYECVD